MPLDILLDDDELDLVRRRLELRTAAAQISGASGLLIGLINEPSVSGSPNLPPLRSQINKQTGAIEGFPVERFVKTKRNLTPPSRTAVKSSKAQPDVLADVSTCLSSAAGAEIKFTHLRHSFASYLLATLLLPEGEVSATVPKQFASVISYERKARLADRLLGPEKGGQHALHAASALMGHADSQATLRSYAHLLDLTLCQYVSRPAVAPVYPAIALKKALKQSSLPEPCNDPSVGELAKNRWYTRPKLPSAPIADRPGHYSIVTSRARGAQHVERSVRDATRVRKLTLPRPISPAEMLSEGIDWRDILAALNGSDVHPKHWAWFESARRILALKTRNGKRKHGPAIFSPATLAPRVIHVDKRWKSNIRLTKKERDALFFAVCHWDVRRRSVKFRSRPLAVAWRNLLTRMGYEQSEIRLSLTGMADLPSATIHKDLEKSTNLPGTAATRGRRGSIGVGICSAGRMTKEGSVKHYRQFSDAAYFLMLMLAIREGFGAPA